MLLTDKFYLAVNYIMFQFYPVNISFLDNFSSTIDFYILIMQSFLTVILDVDYDNDAFIRHINYS